MKRLSSRHFRLILLLLLCGAAYILWACFYADIPFESRVWQAEVQPGAFFSARRRMARDLVEHLQETQPKLEHVFALLGQPRYRDGLENHESTQFGYPLGGRLGHTYYLSLHVDEERRVVTVGIRAD